MSDEKTLRLDLMQISIREYRELFSDETTREREDEILAKAFGLTYEQLLDLPQPKYRLAIKQFFDEATKPLDDPN